MTTQVNPHFTQDELIRTALAAAKDGELSIEARVDLLVAAVHEQQDLLAQEQQANAALLGWFHGFRALVCKAAWALALPGSDGGPLTGFGGGAREKAEENFKGHAHQLLSLDAYDALASLAALDTSGYAPAPPAVGTLIPGTGTGDTPPRYEPRDSRTYLPPRPERKVPS